MKKVAALLLLLLATLSGCVGVPPNQIHNEIVIGVILPLSGEYQEFGQRSLNAMKMAVTNINAVGGVSSRTVRLSIADSAGTQFGAEQAMTQLVMSEGAVAVIGAYSTNEGAGMKKLAELWRFPVVLTQATGDELTEKSQFVSRCCFPDSIQSKAMAYYLRNELKIKKIAVIFSLNAPESYSRNLAFRIGKAFAERDGDVVTQIGFSGDELSALELEQVTTRGPEAIILPVYPERALKIIKQFRAAGYSGIIVGGDSYDGALMEKESPENCIYSTICFRDGGSNTRKMFAEAIQKINKCPPGNAEFMGYEGVQMVLAACREAKNSSDVAKNLQRMKSFSGLGETVYLNKERNALRPVPIIRFTNEGPKLVKSIAPEVL